MASVELPTTRWRLQEGSPQIRDLLVNELGLNPIISRIIINRGFSDPEEVRRYLAPSLRDLHNPFLMQDMKKAVDRLVSAVYRNEKIMIYGDYDADGITSVVILLLFLKKICPRVTYYIPDRIKEGYGLNRDAIERFRSEGVGLIVTVDCGIADHAMIVYANQLGIDTIILDHHELSDTIPAAVAAVNPKRLDCQFPFKNLAAVGIVFNFLIAVRGTLRQEGFWDKISYPNLKEYLDLVALGTIGDIVPLVDENRIFAKIGLELISENRRIGLSALKQVSGIDHQVFDSNTASFTLIPRINAAGRIASASMAVELLMSEIPEQAYSLARALDDLNRRRQAMEKEIFNNIIEKIEDDVMAGKRFPFVFSSSRWHPGVIGIVASKLVDRFGRPAILISLKDGVGKGSGRSVENINIYELLKRCESILLSFGGHHYAAGISIREDDIGMFSKMLQETLFEDGTEPDFTVSTNIDAQCRLSDITHELIGQIAQLAPFGSQNTEPVLCVRNVSVLAPSVVGNNHLKMRVSHEGISRNSIWFSKGDYLNELSSAMLDIVFTPQINTWNGISDIQLKMRDVAAVQTNA